MLQFTLLCMFMLLERILQILKQLSFERIKHFIPGLQVRSTIADGLVLSSLSQLNQCFSEFPRCTRPSAGALTEQPDGILR